MNKNRILSFCKSKELSENEIREVSGGAAENKSITVSGSSSYAQGQNQNDLNPDIIFDF